MKGYVSLNVDEVYKLSYGPAPACHSSTDRYTSTLALTLDVSPLHAPRRDSPHPTTIPVRTQIAPHKQGASSYSFMITLRFH